MVKKVDNTIARAFARGEKAKGNNTVCDGSAVYLHGHRIAWRTETGEVRASLCGWDTLTTRARLNAICQEIGARGVFYHRNGVLIYGMPNISETAIRADDVVILKHA